MLRNRSITLSRNTSPSSRRIHCLLFLFLIAFPVRSQGQSPTLNPPATIDSAITSDKVIESSPTSESPGTSASIELIAKAEQGMAAAATPLPASPPKPTHVVLPQDVQVVSFQSPDGIQKLVLGPQPFPGLGVTTSPEGHLIAGMKVGTTSIVQFTSPQQRAGKNIYASIEIYGHQIGRAHV